MPTQSDMSLSAMSWLVSACCAGIMCWILACLDKQEADRCVIALAIGWAMAAVLSAMIGSWQFLGLAPQPHPLIASSAQHEVYANLRQRNQLATLLMMGAMILLWFCQNKAGVWRVITWTALTLVICCLAATASRTGFVQLIALSLMILRLRQHLAQRLPRHLIAMLVIYALALVALPWLSRLLALGGGGLLSRLDDSNAFSRLALWSNVLDLIAQKPWTGHGWRSLAYAHYSTEFSGARFMELLDNAHNLPLHLAVELGLPVALSFCGFVIWAVWRAKPWLESQPDRQMAWGILLVIGIHSMVEYPLWYGPFFLTALLCSMILCADVWKKWLFAGTQYRKNAIILGVRGLAISLLACTTFAAIDYHRASQIYLQPQERSSWYADDALGAAQRSVLFKSHAKFAELVITPLSRETAPRVLELSSELVIWSPEPRVIEKLIESSVMMGLDDLAAFHLKRYRVAYPQAYATWAAQAQKSITSVL